MRRLSILVLAAALSSPSFAQPAAAPASDVREAQARASRAEEIGRLRASAANATANPTERVAILRRLAFIDQDEANSIAATLTRDPSTAVAVEAVDQLASFVALMGHGGHATAATPWEAALVGKHAQAITALRAAATDDRPVVAEQALAALMRQSDSEALSTVRNRFQNGTISASNAGRLCAQAAPDTGRACLIDLLNSESVEGQGVAIRYLGARRTEQAMIRNKVLFNTKQSPQARSIAAETLGRYDESFSNYGLTVAADSATPAPVFASVVKAFADRERYLGKLDAAQRSQLVRAIDSKITETSANTAPSKRSQALAPLLNLKVELAE